MDQKIIYQTDTGGVAVMTPVPEAVALYGSVDAVAQRDVPNGKPYKIVDASEIPADRTFREAWEVDADSLTDGVGTFVPPEQEQP